MLSGDHKSKQNSSKRRTIAFQSIDYRYPIIETHSYLGVALATTRMMAERKEVWVEKQKKGG